MPELPEVQSVRQTLLPRLRGRRVVGVVTGRYPVITGDPSSHALLLGRAIREIARHGKQLALVPDKDVGPVVCVHLGMSGSLRYYEPAGPTGRSPQNQPPVADPDAGHRHVHVTWRLDDGGCLRFRDPRRFGGIWTYESYSQLHAQRWGRLGPDALTITPADLHRRLGATSRSIKAALLDQTLIAGLGNIYVDELLFACQLHPQTPANLLPPAMIRRLVRTMRRLLSRAIAAGGSTLRDYVNGDGDTGRFQTIHRVYGRAAQPCRRCRAPLAALVVAGRTSTFCPTCQRLQTTTVM